MIYLDYAAATPLDSRVLAAMQPFLQTAFYNPSSPYTAAREVKKAVEAARAGVGYWLGARPSDIIFTAGATESINLAIHGVMQKFPETNVVVSAIEHDAILASAARYPHTIVPVQSSGSVDMDALRRAINDQTVLVSIGYANNEIGTIQSLKTIADIVADVRINRQKTANALPLYMHSDASQAAGYLDLHVSRLGVDLLTLNGGKMYGPKQTGILFVKSGTQLLPLITGGGQELGLRSGTENVAGAIGFAVALDLAQTNRKDAITTQAALRNELQRRLVAELPSTIVNGNVKKRLPNNLHVSWPDVDGERLVMLLDERGVQAATGSACAANKQIPSHVLRAIGLDDATIQGSLRLTLGSPTTPDDIAAAARIIIDSVKS